MHRICNEFFEIMNLHIKLMALFFKIEKNKTSASGYIKVGASFSFFLFCFHLWQKCHYTIVLWCSCVCVMWNLYMVHFHLSKIQSSPKIVRLAHKKEGFNRTYFHSFSHTFARSRCLSLSLSISVCLSYFTFAKIFDFIVEMTIVFKVEIGFLSNECSIHCICFCVYV